MILPGPLSGVSSDGCNTDERHLDRSSFDVESKPCRGHPGDIELVKVRCWAKDCTSSLCLVKVADFGAPRVGLLLVCLVGLLARRMSKSPSDLRLHQTLDVRLPTTLPFFNGPS